jgi:hypothetical protein
MIVEYHLLTAVYFKTSYPKKMIGASIKRVL